ncbi:polyketide synthase [Actinokineospora iranica]|uniref:Epothilone polyketide synthase D n=1 Tax=Actinokineospora iranica TaxID=1271860 RepID=A0A1G6PJM1_9PSEU|nr:polyketide synthase [Actinokineospora iranica]SDC79555.1 epothilone polyketide synthase D [Actinokineospora iranica]
MSYIDYLDSLSKKQLMVMLARRRQEDTEPIALVGMGARLPGGIGSPDELWAALRGGRVVPTSAVGPPLDSLGRARWNLDAPDLAPIADVLAHGAFLSDVDVFDAAYFGISDAEALHMDPQQRLLLEVAVAAVADANLTLAELRRATVGVFVAAGQVEYPFARLRNGTDADDLSPFMSTGSGVGALSGRIGMGLGVSGPAVSIDTASSSMLTAVHLAEQSLRRGECDVALVGVCNLVLSPFSTAILARAGMVSPSGRSRPFTARADGHVRGEGCGVVVLTRASDPLASRVRPYAVIRAGAVHQHGDRPAMSVASAAGQRTVIDLALRRAGVRPHDVHYVEAQANGSRIGGIIEAETLSQAYERDRPGAPPLYLGSCKANLGYAETASGAAALMKTALMLAHQEIAPQVGADDLDPGVPWQGLGLRFAAAPTSWPVSGPRRAAVSGYGFAGTLAHVILEGVDSGDTATAGGSEPALLVLSAHNAEALAATALRLHTYLADHPELPVESVCRTLALGRDHGPVRAAAVVPDRTSLLAKLAAIAKGTTPDLPGEGELAALAARFRAGADVDFGARDNTPALCRLPGPVLTGRSFWPTDNIWH